MQTVTFSYKDIPFKSMWLYSIGAIHGISGLFKLDHFFSTALCLQALSETSKDLKQPELRRNATMQDAFLAFQKFVNKPSVLTASYWQTKTQYDQAIQHYLNKEVLVSKEWRGRAESIFIKDGTVWVVVLKHLNKKTEEVPFSMICLWGL